MKPIALLDQLSILIPVYNEGENIHGVLESIRNYFGRVPEVLICYDFDEDNTLPEARKYVDYLSLRFIKNTGMGVLSAIRTGFQKATRPAILVTMADLSDDLSVVPSMLEHFSRGAVVVAGSRYMRGGSQIGGPWLKKTLSRIAGVSLHYLTAVATHDATNNFRLYSKSFLDSVVIESRGGFELALELTAKAFAKNHLIAEVPTSWHDRSAGKSRFQLRKWLPHYLRWYFFAIESRLKRR